MAAPLWTLDYSVSQGEITAKFWRSKLKWWGVQMGSRPFWKLSSNHSTTMVSAGWVTDTFWRYWTKCYVSMLINESIR
jgi:hypothetical protein